MTAREIGDVLEIHSRSPIIRAAASQVPAAPRTGRMRAKDEERLQAIALRKEGRSYSEIRAELGVSKGSLSLWLAGVELQATEQERLEARRLAGGRSGAAGRRRTTEARDEWYFEAARQWLGEISPRELTLLGAVAYWCEGGKTKPWRTRRLVDFINSDPGLIQLFMRWLAGMNIALEDLIFRVHIHESANVAAAEQYWADLVGVDTSALASTTLKRHNPATIRRNVEDEYRGCLQIRVRRSADLYRKIEGIWRATVESVLATPQQFAGFEPLIPATAQPHQAAESG